MYLNRVVAVAAAAVSLALAALPVIGNFDWTSTAGILAGTIAVLGIALKWLSGWQAYEARQVPTPSPAVEEEDEGPGDPDALPHFPAKNPAKIPADKGDAGATA